MGIVSLLPFVTEPWQIYLIIFFLNIFNAFFTPAYKAALPQAIDDKSNYASGIALSNATNQLLGVLGPGIAGGLAAWLGAREIFFVDAASFIIAGVFVLTLPSLLVPRDAGAKAVQAARVWTDVLKGTRLLFADRAIRFALLMELVAAIAGAQLLVNTVGYIIGTLQLTSKHYGYAMAAFGLGATVAAFASGNFDRSRNRTTSLLLGGVVVCVSVALGNYAAFPFLVVLWLLEGFSQTLAEMPTQILIAERTPAEDHGKVYGAHFAWTHLWWAVAYPIAGLTSTFFPRIEFVVGASLAFVVFVTLVIISKLPSQHSATAVP